jgi:HlyD family secretion protein
MRRWIIGTILVLLIAAGGYYIFQQQQAAADSEIEILREATIEEGIVTSTVNAVGAIEPEALVTLTFGMAGTIQEINIVRGQIVAAGDVMATLDTAELLLVVQQSQDALTIQELTLQQRLNNQPTAATLSTAEADIAAAEANLVVAEANLAGAQAGVQQVQAQRAQLLTGATPGQIAGAEANIAAAQLAQKNAQETYNRTLDCFDPPGGGAEVCPLLGQPEEQARANLQNANASLAAAEAQLSDLLRGASGADVQAADAAIANAEAALQAAAGNILAAEANLARAQAAYERLLEPPSAAEIDILEAQIAAASTNLALAELRLTQSMIVAPLSGRVANVVVNAGEQASPGAPAMTIVDEAAFHITVNVDEIDIDRIALDQVVEITLDALPDTPVSGTISEIAPTAAAASGVVTYIVTINIDAPEGTILRAGMSANAAIEVEQANNVLIVPNWAIRLNRETGEAFVNKLGSDGTVTEVVIETGLRNEQFSELRRGLTAGDVVVLTNEREAFSLFGGGEE